MNVPEQHYPTVDIIIPYYKRRDMLERCLDSLENTIYPAMSIVVLDNGGKEAGLVFLVKRYRNARLERLPENKGYAGGCNAGLKSSSADFVVFMNDDTVHDPQWLDRLILAALEDDLIGALQPKILSLKSGGKGKRVFDYAGAAGGMLDRLGYPYCLGRKFARLEFDQGQYDSGQDIFWASGVAMFVKRAVAEELGGFDEDFFMQMEEIDLSWRMKLAGYHVRSVPSAVILHEGGASLQSGSVEKIYFNHRNNITMLLKNRSMAGLCWLVPVRCMLDVVTSIYYLTQLSGGVKKSGAVWRAIASNIRQFSVTLKKRQAIQCARVVDEHTLFGHAPISQMTGR
jgi:GT2 family glycosyltransferase